MRVGIFCEHNGACQNSTECVIIGLAVALDCGGRGVPGRVVQNEQGEWDLIWGHLKLVKSFSLNQA